MSLALFTDFWLAARERLGWLRALFGSPGAFLRGDDFTRAARREVLSYLAPLERMVRGALIAMALAQCGPHKPAAVRARRQRTRAAARWPGPDSETWSGVSFRVLDRSGARRGAGERCAPAEVYYRYPLARRMEALARAIANPDPIVRRLARRLCLQAKSADTAARFTAPAAASWADVVIAPARDDTS